jgi:hypothetical protein
MRTKQVRPDTLEFEFELYISREFDTTKNVEYILFDFHTVKVFENFEYKINVEPNIDVVGKVLEFNVEGLSAPVISLSRSGTAQYSYAFYEFKQTEYTLNLYNQSNDKILYKIKILKTDIKITRQPSKKFIKVIPQRVSETD